jgi:peptidoglycan-N-acetylglucosamine deacetylase
MFTFRTTTIVFFILLFLMNILGFAGLGIHYWHYLILIGIYLIVSVTFSFFIRSGFHMQALSRGNTVERSVAITFDDGPDVEFTSRILDVLHDADVSATFFCIGRKIDGNEELVRRMDKEGHLIGTHSYSHSNWFDLFSAFRMRSEFQRSEEKIIRILGKRPLMFRPPYGVINPMVKRALKGMGYQLIGFSNRAWDTVTKKENRILERLVGKVKPGDIILLHDTMQQNIGVLKGLLDWLSRNNHKVVSLDKLLDIRPYEKI